MLSVFTSIGSQGRKDTSAERGPSNPKRSMVLPGKR